jgi:tetratricopeptide (TPR) repeat protein
MKANIHKSIFLKSISKILLASLMLLAFPLLSSAQYDHDVFYNRGRQAISDGKYSTAIENFNILARLDTTDYWAFFFRGIAKYNLGDLRGAQRDFETSVRIDPVFTNGYHYRAITLSRIGKYDEALKDLQKAIDLRPGYEGIYFSRGVTYFLAQQFRNAVSDFDYYIRKEPKDPSAYLNRGASYLFLGDTLKAINDYNKAIKLDRFEPEGYIRRGRLYAAQGKYDDAIKDLDKSIKLDSTNTFAYFNRALMYYDRKNYNAAMADLNRVLKDEPGNALTLYNRSLISAQVGNFEDALEDMDRVININPNNVLAYFNRASYFIEMRRWADALDDYNKAIDLYPDFAKAYINRSFVENMLGRKQASKEDYKTASRKVQEYRAKNQADKGSFADTTKKYSSLLSLDADFAKKDFNNELLQHRDIDIRLKPLYRFALTAKKDNIDYALKHRFENALLDKFVNESPTSISIICGDSLAVSPAEDMDKLLYSDSTNTEARTYFLRGLLEVQGKQYNAALNDFDKAVQTAGNDRYADLYKAFYYMNRGVLRAQMIEFISTIESNVQTLTMDTQGATRVRVNDQVSHVYDYSEAINDMKTAASIVSNVPYFYYNLGNLYCLSSKLIDSIDSYNKAINLYPYMGEAYYNRGLVLIYLKDKEKGCIDLSRAGELGVADAYSVISKFCEEEKQ